MLVQGIDQAAFWAEFVDLRHLSTQFDFLRQILVGIIDFSLGEFAVVLEELRNLGWLRHLVPEFFNLERIVVW